MSLLNDFLLKMQVTAANPNANRAARRVAQAYIDEARGGTKTPIVGGLYDAPLIGLAARAVGLASEPFGLAQEAADVAGKAATGAGEAGYATLLAHAFGDPLSYTDPSKDLGAADITNRARRAWERTEGSLLDRALAANEAGASGDQTSAFLQGGLNFLLSPSTLFPIAGELGAASKIPGVAKAAGVADAINDAMNLPATGVTKGVGAATRGGARLLGTLLAGTEDAGRNAALQQVTDRTLTKLLDEDALLRRNWTDLPTAPEAADYATYARKVGYPALAPLEDLASPLAPDKPPSLLAEALARNGGAETGRLGLPLIPEPLDVRLAQREQGLPLLTRVPDLGDSPLLPDKTPSLLSLARQAERNAPKVAPPSLADRLAERGQLPLAEAVDQLAPAADQALSPTRDQLVRAVANGPLSNLTVVLRDLHGAVYPGGKTDFAIPALTGRAARDFRTSFLTDHPSGNLAEPYLDYLIARVQTDPKAAARLATSSPDLLAELGRFPTSATPAEALKRALQERLGAGPFKAGATTLIDNAGKLIDLGERAPLPGTPALAAPAARTASAIADVAADTPALAAGATDGRAAFDALVQDWGSKSSYLPEAAVFAKRLGIPVEEAQGYLDELVQRGDVGDAGGVLAFKPRPGAAVPPLDVPPASAPYGPDAEFVAALQDAARAGKHGEVAALVEVANLFGLDQGQAQRLADEALGITGREADQAAELATTRLQEIEASPYFAAFRYFNKAGDLKATNPITGARIINRNGGKFGAFREGVGNVIGNGYDDVADTILANSQAGGHNQNFNMDAGEFWTRAQQAFREYQQLKGETTKAGRFVGGGDIAAGGGGGGTLFVLPGANALGQLGRAALAIPRVAPGLAGAAIFGTTGAAGGALGGAAVGYASNPEDRWGGLIAGAKQGALGGAAAGAAIGGVAGAVALSHVSPEAWQAIGGTTWQAMKAAQASAFQRTIDGHVLPTPRQIGRVWSGYTVDTLRQLIQDPLWAKTVLAGGQGTEALKLLRPIQDQAARNAKLTGNARLSTYTRSILAQLGQPDRALNLGADLASSVPVSDLSATQAAIARGVISVAGGPSNLLGALGATATGAFYPAVSAGIRTANGQLNAVFREAAFVDEWGKLLPKAADQLGALGYDISRIPLDQATRAEVTRLHGAQAGAIWQQMLENVAGMAEARTRFLLGDYSKGQGVRGFIERVIGTGIPFTSWTIRAYPVALEMAIRHPLVAYGVYQALRLSSQGAGKDGRPGYTAGMVPIPTSTPLLGAAARSMLGGQDGTAYIAPAAAISPLGGAALAPPDEGDQSLYQQVSDTLNRAGLPGVNPIVGALAFILGLDFRQPSNLSRTQGIENAAALLPGNTMLPDVGGALLRYARSKASPAFAATELGAKVGAQADQYPTAYDPVARRYGELVAEQTKLPLSDPANRAYVYDLAAGVGDLYDQAQAEVLVGGAARNGFSLTSPIGVAVQSASTREAKVAKGRMPTSYQDIKAAQDAGATSSQVARLKSVNADYVRFHPQAAAYDIGSRGEAQSLLLHDATDRAKQFGVKQTPALLLDTYTRQRARAEAERLPAKRR